MHPRIIPLLALVALATLAPPVAATTLLPLADGALADRATLIVEGRIDDVAAARRGGPAIEYRVTVAELLAGTAPAELILRLPGGVGDDGRGLRLLGVPTFAPGERVLLFLAPRGDVWTLTDLALGAFTIVAAGDRDQAVRPAATRELHRPGIAPATRKSRDLTRFRGWLRDRAAGRARPADYFVAAPAAPPDKFALFVSSTLPPPLGCGPDGGHPIRWPIFDGEGAVVWHRHAGGQLGLADGGAAAFARARAAWSEAGTPVALTDGGTSVASGGLRAPDGENVLLFGDPNDELPGSFEGGGLLALGGVWFDCAALDDRAGVGYHVAFESDVVIQDGVESFLLASVDPERAAEELYGHELGHTLGLAHSADAEALMFALIRDDGRGALLADDDYAALELLYVDPTGGTVSPPPPPDDPPPTPADLAAILAEDTVVELGWNHPRAGDGIEIERRLEDGVFVLVATVGGVAGFTDDGLLPAHEYGYRVRAISPAGVSPYSEEVRIATGGSLAPAAPSNLRAAPTSSSRILLSWQDNADDELFQRVELRRGGEEVWDELPAIAAGVQSLAVEGLDAASSYRFRVRAEGLVAASAPSNAVAVTTFMADAPCLSDDRRLCLLGGRFEVSVRWRNPADGSTGDGFVIPSTDRTGQIWFFRPNNVELIVKMIDGSAGNGHAWVFYGGLSSLEYWITVRDLETGAEREYHSPAGDLCGVADTLAFDLGVGGDPGPGPGPIDPAVPSADPRAPRPSPRVAAGSCVPDPETLCLQDGRFRVQVVFRNQHDGGREGIARAIAGERSGSFFFFNVQNTELMVKILDGRRRNDHFWLFSGALSEVEHWITATDLVTGLTRVYHNPPGEICGRADLSAFPDQPPEPGEGAAAGSGGGG